MQGDENSVTLGLRSRPESVVTLSVVGFSRRELASLANRAGDSCFRDEHALSERRK